MARWSVAQAVLLAVEVLGTITIITTTPVEAATTIPSLQSATSVAKVMDFTTISLSRADDMSNGRTELCRGHPFE
uniref:Putative secreted protein n=1 Tax=Anopheles triannulatus TaxID=58253 RepID=A0A2M4B4R5_9DIPT